MKEHRVLISKAEIAEAVHRLGGEINRDYSASERLVVIGVLKGAFIFLADLVREIKVPTQVEFMGVSSYSGKTSTGQVRITHDLTNDIAGADVLLVEDIIDTGLTIDYLSGALAMRKPKSLRVCSFLSKPKAHKLKCRIDYVGFSIGNEFVIGYGLDYDGSFRGLPYVAHLD